MRVFISSTSRDLEPFRAAARDVVLDLGWQPVMMEHFRTDGEAGVVSACRRRVLKCDVMLAILAWKQGGVPGVGQGGDGKTSYTQWELKAADEDGKPILVLMADDNWPGRLWENDVEARAAVKNFRGELDRLAVFFAWEEERSGVKEPLPRFQATVRQELVRHQQTQLESNRPGAEVKSPLHIRVWPEPEWPETPYPLLLPYRHPALFAGRERELAEVRRRLRLPVLVFGLYGASGAGKSSLLEAGLVSALRAEGRAVALDRQPAETGLAARLIGDLLAADRSDGEAPAIGAEDLRKFVRLVLEARRLAGRPPILILDQFEDLLRRPEHRQQRAAVGMLLATTAQRQPGLADPPCRWLLAYRQEFHGEVSSWLADVLRDARSEGLAAAAGLPHDLSNLERWQNLALPPFGTPAPGAELEAEAARLFRDAIEMPLATVAAGGAQRYPWRFVGDGSRAPRTSVDGDPASLTAQADGARLGRSPWREFPVGFSGRGGR